MYKPTKDSLPALKEQRQELTRKVLNGQDLDYLAMEKLKRQLAKINQEIKEWEEAGNG